MTHTYQINPTNMDHKELEATKAFKAAPMDRKELEATKALKAALAALDEAIMKCGDAEFSFMNVVEPLLGARECTNVVLKIASGQA